MLEPRRVFLVPPCDSEEDGELNVLGVKKSKALGDAFGDIPLRAVYSGPGLACEQTAAAISQRHGLVVRKKPAFGFDEGQPFGRVADRVIRTFENVARASPGRTALIVVEGAPLRIIVSHCTGVAPSPDDRLILKHASVTELTVEADRYIVERLGDTQHIIHLV